MPGPGNYLQEAQLSSLVTSDKGKKNQAFGVKEKRFRPDDTEVPGPGQYVMPSTVIVKEGTREMANYKSASLRTAEKIPQLPGVGQYNLVDHLSLSNKQI